MRPADFSRQLWSGHRILLSAVILLVLVNLTLLVFLQQYYVPMVNAREQELIRRQSEYRGVGMSDSPVQLFTQGKKDLTAFREKIPTHREFTGLVADIQSMAEKAGLELNQISYRHDQDKDGDLLRYMLSFNVMGDYRSVKQFIHALEQSRRIIIIGQVSLQGVGEGNATDVRLQLNLETFFRPGVS